MIKSTETTEEFGGCPCCGLSSGCDCGTSQHEQREHAGRLFFELVDVLCGLHGVDEMITTRKVDGAIVEFKLKINN